MDFSWEQIAAPWAGLPESSRLRWGKPLEQVTPPPLMLEMSAAHLSLESFNPRELSEKAAQDAVLGARLLAVANSAKFGLASPLTSIQRAVVHLGFNLVKSISVTYMLETSFQKLAPAAKAQLRFNRQLSAGASVLAHKWAQLADMKDPSTVATVALLSRVGGLLLMFDANLPNDAYRGIKDDLARMQMEWSEWEATLPSLSAEQTTRWGLPEPIPSLILRQWEPLVRELGTSDEDRLLAVVAASLLIVRHYMDDTAIKPGTVIDQPQHLRLKDNLVRLKLLDSLVDIWNNARLQRELAGAVLEA
jgi:HD-like signal output (HDOD) protein